MEECDWRLRKCRTCGVTKDIEDFPFQKNRGGPGGHWSWVCKACRTKRRQNNKYGVRGSQEPPENCPICKKKLHPKHVRRDHDHESGLFRDFLCHHCNTMLGMSGDSIEVLQAGIDYLRKHEQT